MYTVGIVIELMVGDLGDIWKKEETEFETLEDALAYAKEIRQLDYDGLMKYYFTEAEIDKDFRGTPEKFLKEMEFSLFVYIAEGYLKIIYESGHPKEIHERTFIINKEMKCEFTSDWQMLGTSLKRPLEIVEVIYDDGFTTMFCERCEKLVGGSKIVINGTRGKLLVEGDDLDIPPIRDCLC